MSSSAILVVMARARNVPATWIFETKTWLGKLPGLKVGEPTRGAHESGTLDG
jgi:hypothetical protein